ncbi:IS110 family transposase [Pedobacter heparinus]|uniref:IS110 family transposase n=1 Tax=Pedobacter heparinus TaxID=984 RepID=UPI00292E9C88|nr:IS110 family transposase [Pedobacter heparinus]
MEKVIKQTVGIDVAKEELVVCLGYMFEDLRPDLRAYSTFENTKKGFRLQLQWVKKIADKNAPLFYVMEATGVYHESLAYFLKDQEQTVCIVLPNKINNYAKSLSVKTVTDKTACEAITKFGLSHYLEGWEKPSSILKRIKQLTRERDQIIKERTRLKNQLHAEKSEAEPNKSTISRINKRITLLTKQAEEIVEEVTQLVNKDQKASQTVQILDSIPGIGILTAATIIAETNCFDLIRSKRQLTSYAGLDVQEKTSGTSVKGKPRISKKGNKYLRKVMNMSALTAVRIDGEFKSIYTRIHKRHGIKMKAMVAIQRKLLEMTYTLYKNQQPYDKEHFKNSHMITEVEPQALEN